MKKIIASLFLVFLCSNAFSYTETFNPYTGKLDKVGASASSDIGIVCPAGEALISSGSGTWACGSAGSASVGGTVSSGTKGSVLFINPDSTLAQNNQNFNYSDSLSKLSAYGSLSSELLTNGTFTGSASGWSVGSGYAYSSNSVSHTSNGTAPISQTPSTNYAGHEYVVTYTISAWTVGTVTPSLGGVTGTAVSANGTYTERFVTTSTATLSFTPSNTARFTIDSVSVKTFKDGSVRSGTFYSDGSWSNSSPGTTRSFSINNLGSYSWMDFYFSGTLKAAIGSSTSGGIDLYQSGGNGVSFNTVGGGLYSYNYPGYFYHSGYASISGNVQSGGKVGAGTGAFTAPTSTLQSAGGLGLKVKRITS